MDFCWQMSQLMTKKLKSSFSGRQTFQMHVFNDSSCTTTSLSKVLTSCLTAIKNHWIKYCEKTYEREGINYFWSIKNSNEILNKLKTNGFQASTISTYDFSTLCTI